MELGVWNLEYRIWRLEYTSEETRLCDPAVLPLHGIPSVADGLRTEKLLEPFRAFQGAWMADQSHRWYPWAGERTAD